MFVPSNYKSVILFLGVLGFVFSENLTLQNPEPEEWYGSASCGGILQKEYGDLEYKSHGFVEPNERCVWIIRPPAATGFDIRVKSLGLNSSLIITAIGDDLQHIIPEAQGNFQITKAYALVVTFYTDSSSSSNYTRNTRGFSLDYDYDYTTQRNISDRSYSKHLQGDFGHLKYYFGQTYLGSKPELSLFVVSPVREINGNFKKTEIAYFADGLENMKYDLHVYLFNRYASASNKWEYTGSIKGVLEYDTISNSDAILLVFRSNGVVQQSRHGFYLSSHVSP